MMKKVLLILLALLVSAIVVIPVLSEDSLPLVIDNAGLLTGSEEKALSDKLSEISNRLDCDVVVLTEPHISGSAESYADDYFDYSGYGRGSDRDGIFLLVAMDSREWHVSGSGICNSRYIGTEALEYISEFVPEDLGSENYADCFDTFANRCDEVISTARSGKEWKETFDLFGSLAVSVIIGFIAAFVITGVMKGKLKTVRHQAAASSYLVQDSLKVTKSYDMFLYRQITRTKRQQNSSSHKSSSGRSHSGVGGKF